MSAAGLVIPEEAVTKVATGLFGPEPVEGWRREAVEMALTDVSRILYDTWIPEPRKCPSRSCMDVECDLTDGHAELHTGHLGATSMAWAKGRFA